MCRALFAVLLLILLPAGFSGAAGYTLQSSNGIWRFDPGHTRELCGDKAAEVAEAMSDNRVEIVVFTATDGYIRRVGGQAGGPTGNETIRVSAEISGDTLTLRNPEHGALALRFLSADSLLVRSQDGLSAVWTRTAPSPGANAVSGG